MTQTKDSDGSVSFAAYDSAALKKRQEELKKDYIEACKEWVAAKKEAVKNGEKFEEPKPVAPKVKSSKVKGKVRADSAVAVLERKYEAYLAKKQAKETAQDELKDDGGLTDDSAATAKSEAKAEPAEKPKSAPPVADVHFVVAIQDHTGKKTVEVVPAVGLSSRLIRLQKDFMAARKACSGDDPKPTPPKYKTTRLASKGEAETLAAKLRREMGIAPQPPSEMTSLR